MDFLILEDDPLTGRLAKELLNIMGLSADLCETPQDAFGHLQKNTYAYLLLDVHLPEMDGFQFLTYLSKNIKVIFFSAATNIPNHPQRIGFLKKPFQVETFFATMNAIVSEELCQHAS